MSGLFDGVSHISVNDATGMSTTENNNINNNNNNYNNNNNNNSNNNNNINDINNNINNNTTGSMLSSAHDAMSALHDEIDTLRTDLSRERTEKETLISKFSALSNENNEKTAELLLLSALSSAASERSRDVDSEAQKRRFQEFLDNSPHVAMLTRKCDALDKENTRLRNDLLDAEHRYEFVCTARDLLKSEVGDLQGRLSGHLTAGPDHIAEFEYVQAQLQRLRDDSRAKEDALERSVREVTEERDRLKEELDKAMGEDRIARAEAERNDALFERELASESKALLTQQLAIANEDRNALREDLEYARSSIAQLKHSASEADARHRQVIEEHRESNEKIAEDLAELERFRREWKSMQDAVSAEREAVKSEVTELNALLASHLAGRDTESNATQRLIQEVERGKEKSAAMASDLEQSRSENNRLRVELLEIRETMARRVREADADKERVMRRTVEIAQSADQAVQDGKEKESQIAHISMELKSAREERDTLANALKAAQAESASLNRQLEELRAERRRDHGEFTSYAAKMREHRDALTRSKAHNAELVDQVLNLRSQIDNLTKSLATAEADHTREFSAEKSRLESLLSHETEARKRETEVLTARLERAETEAERTHARAVAESRRLQALLDRAREDASSAGNQLPVLAEDRDRAAFRAERAEARIPLLEDRARSLEAELARVRHEAGMRGKELSARLDEMDIRAEGRDALEQRNADLMKETERLREDNRRLVVEVRRWKDKRITQLVKKPWDGPAGSGAVGADGTAKTREESGWAGRDAFQARRAYEGQRVAHQNVNPNVGPQYHPQMQQRPPY